MFEQVAKRIVSKGVRVRPDLASQVGPEHRSDDGEHRPAALNRKIRQLHVRTLAFLLVVASEEEELRPLQARDDEFPRAVRNLHKGPAEVADQTQQC